MKKKRGIRGFIALVSAFALVVSSLMVVPRMEAQASDASFAGYESVSLADFGVSDGAYSEDSSIEYFSFRKNIKGRDNLNNTVFTTYVTFSTGALLYYGIGGVSDWTSITFKLVDENTLYLICDDWNSAQTFSSGELGLTTLNGTELRLKVAAKIVGSDLLITASVNGCTPKVLTKTGAAGSLDTYLAAIGNIAVRACTNDETFQKYTPVTLSDFGIEEKEYNVESWAYAFQNNLKDGSSLNGKNIVFYTTFYDDYGLLVLGDTDSEVAGTGIIITPDITHNQITIWSPSVTNYSLVFDTSLMKIETLAGSKLKISLALEYMNLDDDGLSNDLKVVASVNDCAERTMYLKNHIELGKGLSARIYGKIALANYYEASPDTLEKISWNDFDITGDVLYTAADLPSSGVIAHNLVGHQEKSTLVNTSFRGRIAFKRQTNDYFISYGDYGLNSLGIRISPKADGTILLQGMDTKVGWPYVTIATLNPAVVARTSLTDGTSFEFGLDIWEVEDEDDNKKDLKINVFVEGVQCTVKAFVWEDALSNHADSPTKFLGTNLNVYNLGEGDQISIDLPENLEKIDWTDFGVTGTETSFTQSNEAVADGSHYLYANQLESILGTSFRGIVKLTRSDTPASTDYYYIVYGAHGVNWDGLRISLENNNLLIQGVGLVDGAVDSVITFATITPESAGLSSFTGTQFELGIDLWAEENDVKMNLFFNGAQYNAVPYTWANAVSKNYLGQDMNILVHGANDAIDVELSELKTCEITENEGGYLLSGTNIYVNDITKVSGTALTEIGEYHVLYKTDTDIYAEDVVCYISGDSHADGVIDCRDLVAAVKVESGQVRMSKIAKAAALDSESMRRMLLGQAIAPVASYSVGNTDKDTMPIGGFTGPYGSLVSEQVYQTIAACGVNFITALPDVYAVDDTQSANVIENLKLAEKYNISIMVTDDRIRGSKAALSNSILASYLKDYSQYKSFAGLSIIDEPSSSNYGDQRNETDVKHMNNFCNISNSVNQFSNLSAYVNLFPLNEGINRDSTRGYEGVYQEYLEKYCREYNPKYLSYDHYPFEWDRNVITGENLTESNGITDSLRYFKNLAIIRNVAHKNHIPFWTMVGSGDYFGDTTKTTVNDGPTEGQFKWQINVELAFGAKGIQYFPLIQPEGWELTDGGNADYRRNGLIGADGNTNAWYNYAKDMNTQIQNVDYVLMNSVNEGLLVTSSGYAKSNMEAANEYGMPILSKYGMITGISTTGTAYGAIAGCFNYQGKTAVYMVNYDVTSTQTITLSLDGTHAFTAINRYGSNQNEATGSLSLGIEQGEAVLVIFDE